MMALRTSGATWFELLTGRDEFAHALSALAATGRVELEAHSGVSATHLLPRLRAASDEYKRLAERYARYWPAAAGAPVDTGRELEEIAARALERLRAWEAAAEPLIAHAQGLEQARAELALSSGLVAASAGALPNLALLGQPRKLLASRAYCLPADHAPLTIPPAVLVQRIPAGEQAYLLALGTSETIDALDEALAGLGARRFALPADLPRQAAAASRELGERIAKIAAAAERVEGAIARLSEAHAVSDARADLDFIVWLTEHVPELPMTEHFAWVTGWTSDASGSSIEAALDSAHVHHLLRFPEAPAGMVRPVVLRNPPWARPFELFARLLGMPATSEADPSQIVAVIAPLMFGFMFADVAQGAVLLAAGLALRRRYPALAMLIPGGAAAMAFGLLFGSVFAREDVLPALWVKPLARPLTLLKVSLAFGCAVMLLGLTLDALQRIWARERPSWWQARAGLVLAYASLVASTRNTLALWAFPLGLLWYWSGSAAGPAPGRLAALGRSLADSVEGLFQLLVNTLSFVRVGAFALAHAGLAAAVVALAAAVRPRPLFWALLALGNLVMIGIEALVVAIQTTRLVLFEFFIRFLHGSGRAFSPLPSPQVPLSSGAPRRKSP